MFNGLIEDDFYQFENNLDPTRNACKLTRKACAYLSVVSPCPVHDVTVDIMLRDNDETSASKWHLIGVMSYLDALTLHDPFQMYPLTYGGQLPHGQRLAFDTDCKLCQQSLVGLALPCPVHYPELGALQHASILGVN